MQTVENTQADGQPIKNKGRELIFMPMGTGTRANGKKINRTVKAHTLIPMRVNMWANGVRG